jgi:hypothetical protein
VSFTDPTESTQPAANLVSLRTRAGLVVALAVLPAGALTASFGAEMEAVPLAPGVKAVWSLDQAWREQTATRERISLNGLWRWQPAAGTAAEVPTNGWGYFKVPGAWPGVTDYMQKDCQRLYPHPRWKDTKLSGVLAAWSGRAIHVPASWAGRRLLLRAEHLNSLGTVFVDGAKVGELRFPGGELDLTDVCRPGATHELALQIVALPLKGVLLSYTDSASAREVKGTVARRGMCGDVYLIGEPRGPRITDVKVEPSVRRRECGWSVAVTNLAAGGRYSLRVRVAEDNGRGKQFARHPFGSGELVEGRVSGVEAWVPEKFWDVHQPHHTCDLEVALLDEKGGVLDAWWGERFGFREFWIDGRDFVLNGTRIFLSAVPLDNAAVGAAWATYAAARESLERLKSFGINYVYTHNYGCEPGSHLAFNEILRAADDVGMMVGFSQPHFSHYDWQLPDADRDNGYARHAEYYVRVAQNHPSVVMYPMSHNATGYDEDMNPDLIDGLQAPRDEWGRRNVVKALRAEAIVRHLDPTRIVYHHASGNLGAMHNSNFYPNFVPVQELSDWFEHWATKGVKPAFTCEYGAPFTWDWTMYRGWFRGQREFGSAKVPWEFCLAEWNAQFFGDAAYRISDAEKTDLRWEARQFRATNLWHRWDYPVEVSSARFAERYPVFALYLTDNWRAFRTWGVSAISPWEYGHFWKLREGVDRSRKELPVNWAGLQRPGFSPDYIEQRYEVMDLAFERADWVATPAAEALLRNNRALLAYLAGKPDRFTSKDHNFLAGETVEKQIIVINNSREPVAGEVRWHLALPRPLTGRQKVKVGPGEQARVPLRLALPASLAPGRYELRMEARLGEQQEDVLAIHVLPPPPPSPAGEGRARIALWDPRGTTARWLKETGVSCEAIDANDDLARFDLLLIGQAALSVGDAAPDLQRVRQGLKVIVFEQSAEALEKRLGFRVAEYGLRRVFPRILDHPLLSGLTAESLSDWRGAATISSPHLKYELRPRHGPTVSWAGMPVSRAWRCGNQGSVASVLVEKPARGDFLPILDGGFSLQFSPLLEYREGLGMVIFCQLDVTGRTEADPAAERLKRNLLRYAMEWKPAPQRRAVYAGEPAGAQHLAAAGITATPYEGGRLSPDEVLIVGASGPRGDGAKGVAEWLKAGGHLVAVGLDQAQAEAWLPVAPRMTRSEHIAAYFERFEVSSTLAGIGPADVHNRDPRQLPLVTSGARSFGDGVLATVEPGNIAFCQLVPWQFAGSDQGNLRRTFRRTSVLLSRLLANLGVAGATPVLERFHRAAGAEEKRWLEGLYLDVPVEWDDPYRFFRW